MAGANYYKCRKDNTHDEIKQALESCGCFVIDVHSLKGLFDLIAIKNELFYFVECKSKGGKLSEDEVKFHSKCPAPIYVLETEKQVFDLVLKGIYNEPIRITKQLTNDRGNNQ